MIISHKHKFIFLRVPKTASTSIQIALAGICGPEDVLSGEGFKGEFENEDIRYPHAQNLQPNWRKYTLKDWHQIIRKRKPINYVHARAAQVIKIVGKDIWRDYYKFCFVRNPFERMLSGYFWSKKNREQRGAAPIAPFNEWIYTLSKNKISTWSRYSLKNKIAVDFIGKYENIETDIAHICKQINIPALKLQKAKANIRTDRRHYSQIINSNSRKYIEKVCQKEMQAFGYAWNDGGVGEA